MSRKLKPLSTVSLLAALGPIHRSSVRFDKPDPETPEKKDEPEKKEPEAKTPAAKPTMLQQLKAFKAAAGDRAGLIARAEKAETDLAKAIKENGDLKARVQQLEGEQAEMQTLLESTLDENANVHQVAAAKSIATVANMGIPERNLPAMRGSEATGADRTKELHAQYKKLVADGKSTEAAAFYAKHKKEMFT